MKRKVVAGAVALAVALAAGSYAYRDSQTVRFLRLAWNRKPPCSLRTAWNAVAAHQALWERIGEIDDDLQLVRTDPAGYELFEAGSRQWWIPRRNRLALAEMIAEQEADVYGGKHGVRSGDVVLDCGANVGVYTRHALDAGARTVVAIEPAPENIDCLRRNFADEVKAGRVIIYPKGVWDTDEEIQIRTFDKESGGNSVALNFPGSREGPRVPLTTIDKIAAELRLDRVDFIKMDIEGAERKALVGARDSVARFQPRMAISLEHRPHDYEAISAIVAKLWPELKYECGPCRWVNTALVGRVQPEELYVSK